MEKHGSRSVSTSDQLAKITNANRRSDLTEASLTAVTLMPCVLRLNGPDQPTARLLHDFETPVSRSAYDPSYMTLLHVADWWVTRWISSVRWLRSAKLTDLSLKAVDVDQTESQSGHDATLAVSQSQSVGRRSSGSSTPVISRLCYWCFDVTSTATLSQISMLHHRIALVARHSTLCLIL